MPTTAEWGWDRYERTVWKNDDGRKCYFGHFRQDIEGTWGPHLSWAICTIRFWARHPVLAMRDIAASGKHPETFADTTVN